MEATFPTPDTDAPRPPTPMRRRPSARELAFLYLVPPLLMALPLGMYRAGLGLPYPSDIAPTVVFLCSDKAAKVTGQVISINGGLNA